MLTIILSLLALNPAHADETGLMKCTGQYRKVETNGSVTDKVEPLAVVGKYPGLIKHELNLEGRQFAIQEDLKTGDILSFIVQLADNSKGIVGRGALDSTGRYTSTDVDGSVIYRLVCIKK